MPANTVMPVTARTSLPAPCAEHQRHRAGDERDRGHHDRPQPQAAGFERGLDDALALQLELARELDDQDRVLAREPHQHDQPDLHEDVVVAAGQPHADQRRRAATSARSGSPPAAASSSRTARRAPGTPAAPPAGTRSARHCPASPAGSSGRSTRCSCRWAAPCGAMPSSVGHRLARRQHARVGVADQVGGRIAVVADHRIGAVGLA